MQMQPSVQRGRCDELKHEDNNAFKTDIQYTVCIFIKDAGTFQFLKP